MVALKPIHKPANKQNISNHDGESSMANCNAEKMKKKKNQELNHGSTELTNQLANKQNIKTVTKNHPSPIIMQTKLLNIARTQQKKKSRKICKEK